MQLKQYVEIIKTKGEEYGVPVLDLYENLGLNPNDEKIREMYAPDGLHLLLRKVIFYGYNQFAGKIFRVVFTLFLSVYLALLKQRV